MDVIHHILIGGRYFCLLFIFPNDGGRITEISDLNIIPGIRFPYGVGISRAQFFYVAFVFVMYVVLIRRIEKCKEVKIFNAGIRGS